MFPHANESTHELQWYSGLSCPPGNSAIDQCAYMSSLSAVVVGPKNTSCVPRYVVSAKEQRRVQHVYYELYTLILPFVFDSKALSVGFPVPKLSLFMHIALERFVLSF